MCDRYRQLENPDPADSIPINQIDPAFEYGSPQVYIPEPNQERIHRSDP